MYFEENQTSFDILVFYTVKHQNILHGTYTEGKFIIHIISMITAQNEKRRKEKDYYNLPSLNIAYLIHIFLSDRQ